MSCGCYIHLVSIRYKDKALVGPVVIQEVRSPHVMQVLHLSGLNMLQGWSIVGASSDTGGEVSSCHAGGYIYLISIRYKDGALVRQIVIQEVRSPHVLRVPHLSDFYTLQGWIIGGASSDTGGEVSSCHAGATSIWSLYSYKHEALVGPVVIQGVRSPHVMQVLHLSDLYTLQGWSIGGASSDTGGEVSSCHAGCFIHLVSIRYKDEALVGPVVIQEVRFPHVMQVLHPSGLYTLQG